MIVKKSDRLNHVNEYYFSTKLQEIRNLQNSGKPIINLGIGSPDLAPPKEVIQAISKAIIQNDKHSYQSYKGIPEFRKAIADFYKKYFQVTLNPENEILPLLGSKEGIMHISMAFLNKGDSVLIPNPSYITYASVADLLGVKTISYNLSEKNNWFPDLNELEKNDLSNVKIMWLNYPNMPTGSTATKEQFKKLISFAKKHRILLVNDNPYSFILNKNPLSILSVKGAKDVAIELNSLSKSFNMAGWRVGMLLGKSKYIQTVLQVKSNMDSGMYYGIQKGAIAALEQSEDWFRKINTTYKKRRKLIWNLLDKLQCTYNKNASGLFVWAEIPQNTTAKELSDKLLYNYNIFVTPGFIFGTNGNAYIRVSLCVNEKQLNEVLKRLK